MNSNPSTATSNTRDVDAELVRQTKEQFASLADAELAACIAGAFDEIAEDRERDFALVLSINNRLVEESRRDDSFDRTSLLLAEVLESRLEDTKQLNDMRRAIKELVTRLAGK